jgi:hypothetical protein
MGPSPTRLGLDRLSAPDAKQAYTHLVDASKRHLAAFDRWATR